MRKYVESRKKTAFLGHRRRAHKRLLVFEFEYDEWKQWWEKHLGPNWLELRGTRKNQYVMARYYDAGPYAAHNVKCILASDNSREIHSNKDKRYSRLRKWQMS